MTDIHHSMLQQLPLGLLLADPQGRISWANDTMTTLLGLDAAHFVGKTTKELPESAQLLLSTDPKLYQPPSGARWFNREVQTDSEGQRLLVVQDVTGQEQLAEENARLRQQVEDLKLTDELTGLPNKRAISQALDLHISRSRRYQNPLSTVMVHVDMHSLAGVHPVSTDPVLLAVSRFLRDRLRWVDQIARWEEKLFLLVLPETAEDDARGLIEKIAGEQSSLHLPDTFGDLRPQLSFGLACWKKGDDMRTLLRGSLSDLQENIGT